MVVTLETSKAHRRAQAGHPVAEASAPHPGLLVRLLRADEVPLAVFVMVVTPEASMAVAASEVHTEEDPMVVPGAEEDPRVVAGAEDVEDLDRIRDPLWGEFEPRVSTKQGSTAGSEMTLPFLFISFGNHQVQN
jgi:hypothetical protein